MKKLFQILAGILFAIGSTVHVAAHTWFSIYQPETPELLKDKK
jgi:cyclic lactone autoinducer peptide